ncbi:MAG: Cys-Gln thioester bond-forming surface protein [Oscillospiraceae bacterium]|jgi:hypothetical protein|nr:Cys-Gln thioester bond-forming surface protein [Oscillospiraceae bacterium]
MKRKMTAYLATFALLFAFFPPLGEIRGDAAPGASDSYSATLRYYDSIQITYTLNYPSGGIWSGAADIPVGGAGVSEQIYCVDPFVPFHSKADRTYWDSPTKATVDEKSGYAAAAPWNTSASMRLNADAVYWLALNGYRGDYLANDGESRRSVARLNSLYPGIGDIDEKIALMATKVAMWKILAGDGVVIIKTSLDGSPEARGTFDALVGSLVSDAVNGRSTGLGMTRFSVEINDEHSAQLNDGGFRFYGPMSVSASLSNSSGGLNLDKVFLNVSGVSSEGISFVAAPNASAPELPAGTVYGTSESEQYIDGFTNNKSGEFYLKIPASRAGTDLLTVEARAKASDVLLAAGTPVVFVYERGGVQDWDAVQAFIGAAADGARANLYAEAAVKTGDSPVSDIYIAKRIENYSPLDENAEFTFRLLYGATAESVGAPVDLSDYHVHGARGVNEADGTFTLRNGGLAFVQGLPSEYYYRFEEIDIPDAFEPIPDYEINIGDSDVTGGSGTLTSAFRPDGDLDLAMATFINVKKPSPDAPEDPGVPETPGTRNEFPYARLYVQKVSIDYVNENVEAVFNYDDDYDFVLESSANGGTDWRPVNLTPDIFRCDRKDGGITDAANGRFVLSMFDAAYIELNADKIYRVLEEDLGMKYQSVYALVQTEFDDVQSEWLTVSNQSAAQNWNAENGRHYSEEFEVVRDGYFWFSFLNYKTNSLSITKKVAGGARDGEFQFNVIYAGENSYEEILPLTKIAENRYTIDPADLNGDAVLTLKDGETAVITGLPVASYKIAELNGSGYEVTYSVNSGTETTAENGETENFGLSGDVAVVFTNTVPGGVRDGGDDDDDGGGGYGDDGDDDDDDRETPTADGDDAIPETGVSFKLVLLIMLSAFAAGAALYRKKNNV